MQRSAPPPPPEPETEAEAMPEVIQPLPPQLAQPRPQCGIGLLLEITSASSAVVVKNVVPGSPSDLSGRIRSGDELQSVNGCSVAGLPLQSVFAMVLGEEGTPINIEMTQYIDMAERNGTYSRQLSSATITLTRAYPIALQQRQTMYSSINGRNSPPPPLAGRMTPSQFDLFGMPFSPGMAFEKNYNSTGERYVSVSARSPATSMHSQVERGRGSVTSRSSFRSDGTTLDHMSNGITQGFSSILS